MEKIYSSLQAFPSWVLILVPVAIGLCVAVIILWTVISRNVFMKNLKRVVKQPELAESLIKSRYPKKYLLKKSSLIERFAQKHDAGVIKLLSLDELWIENLLAKKYKNDFLRVLKFAPEKGLFQCFIVSLEKRNLVPLLMEWLEETGDLLAVRRIALTGKVEEFDGREALDIFQERLYEIREVTGDPEWVSRYFAIKILLHDTDEKSIRAIWDAFHDSHSAIRKTVASEFDSDDRERLYDELLRLAINDPAYQVRNASWNRIRKDFSDIHVLAPEKFDQVEILHVLEFLTPDSKDDENFALAYLDSPNLELRFSAASFLDKRGALDRLCREVDLGDRPALERNFKLLQKASEVNITSFLSAIEKTDNPATLLVCAKILISTGDSSLITTLAKNVFTHFDNLLQELYDLTLACVSKRGNEDALILLDRELNKRKNERPLMEVLLPAIPQRNEYIFIPTLLNFFKDPCFQPKRTLRDVLQKMPISLFLPELFEILKSEGERYPHVIRTEALKLLGALGMPYCLQTILENLPLLPINEAKEFAQILSEYPKEVFTTKVEELFKSDDAQIRASIITCLPVTGETRFLKSIKQSLKDADPKVRVASVWALVEFGDARSLHQAVAMLRDPVERVRKEVALALGTHGSKEIVKELKKVLFDENEVASVKSAAILGLASAKSLNAIDILIRRLGVEEELVDEIINALSQKIAENEIKRIIENFKDADPQLREKLAQVFKAMGENGEQGLAELLEQDIHSLNPYIIEVLESTGLVEKMIRKLAHKDPAVRREAAAFLALVGTKAAFRGIVLAARDPDDEVRVEVTKALEKLETKEGQEILHDLENDPHRRVRQYTHWALERLRAKSI